MTRVTQLVDRPLTEVAPKVLPAIVIVTLIIDPHCQSQAVSFALQNLFVTAAVEQPTSHLPVCEQIAERPRNVS
jgi:hypothetical protein